jgi:phage replication-related protein YjqB (UPF0714/DUF867 family)
MAPHGGKIEPGTAEIAEAVAGDDYSFYCFEGIKADGNGVLHIRSHLFAEPRAMEAVESAEIVVTVHGHAGRKDPSLTDAYGSCRIWRNVCLRLHPLRI